MASLLEAISYTWLWAAFIILSLLFLWSGNKADPHIEVKNSPYRRPMFSFELAGTPERGERVLKAAEEDDAQARQKFRTALHWDYLFIFIYTACFIVGSSIVVKFLSSHNWPGARVGLVILALLPVAGILDAVENYALLRVLDGAVEKPWPQLAMWCAAIKFSILAVAFFYEFFGAAFWLETKLQR